MKKCELCKKVARMFCDSDQASLCWDCDSRVHMANFLVAKHVRTLLCHSCQSPTPWTGSGPKLSPTVSVCEACVNGRNRNINGEHDPSNGDTEDNDSEDDEDDENGDCSHEDDDDGENQVVPLSLPPSFPSTSNNTTVQSSRFSYNGTERPEEKNGTKTIRSWRWR
ncbi:hypothetical protein CDL12_14854 [Handroanthus impetiginosus]|uniref:B box-type domain-containing protein n=1 Tax=Handroanthus impetiginosus TaxID=429701 RepID=A0A2G9H4U8_9LAMI|nr:hypothetical protein CDL12_14854 [Handroanthus impetiginosus]